MCINSYSSDMRRGIQTLICPNYFLCAVPQLPVQIWGQQAQLGLPWACSLHKPIHKYWLGDLFERKI